MCPAPVFFLLSRVTDKGPRLLSGFVPFWCGVLRAARGAGPQSQHITNAVATLVQTSLHSFRCYHVRATIKVGGTHAGLIPNKGMPDCRHRRKVALESLNPAGRAGKPKSAVPALISVSDATRSAKSTTRRRSAANVEKPTVCGTSFVSKSTASAAKSK